MNWLDIVILIIAAVSTFIGLRAGLIKMALSLAGLIIGIVLAGHFYMPLADKLAFIQNESIAQVVAFAIILIVVMLIAAVIAVILKAIISAMMLGWVNNLGGSVVGLLVGALFCAALLTLWVKFPGSSQTLRGSILANILLDRFPAVLALLPHEFDSIRNYFK
jgi:membrane protein required for colicin V production